MMMKKKSQGDMLVDKFASLLKKLSTESVDRICPVGMSLHDKDLRQIFNAIAKRETSLRLVDLKDNNIKSSGLDSMCRILRVCPELCYLRLSRNSLNGQAGNSLLRTFQNHRNLKILRLSNNKLRDWGAIAIAKLLKVSKSLELLSLSRNLIGDEGLKSLAGALRTNKTLRCLYLTLNPFSSVGIAHLSDAMKENSTLTVLKLDRCEVDDVGASKLAEMFEEDSKCKLTFLKYRPGNDKITPIGVARLEKYIASNGYVKCVHERKYENENPYMISVGDGLLVCALPGGTEGITILSERCATDPRDKIGHLQICFTDIDDLVLNAFGNILDGPKIKFLRSVKITHCAKITSKGMSEFLKCFEKHLKLLEIIHIADVVFDMKVVNSLISLMKSNGKIESLKIPRTGLTTQTLKVLLKFLETYVTIQISLLLFVYLLLPLTQIMYMLTQIQSPVSS